MALEVYPFRTVAKRNAEPGWCPGIATIRTSQRSGDDAAK